MKLLRGYLRDRLHWVALAYGNTLLVILAGALLLQLRGVEAGFFKREAGYLLLLTTFLLAVVLAFDLLRWRPFAIQQDRLLQAAVDSDALANLPDGGTADQQAGAALVRKVHRLFAAERTRYEEAHRRHLAFIHLWVHQMKTPVSLVGLIAQREGEGAPEKVANALAAVEEQAGKISEGLDLVLGMARLEEFAVDYQVRRVDLAQLVRGVINERKKQFIRLGIYPRLTVATPDPAVLSDAKWLSFAVDQVVGNSLKYSSQGAQGEDRTLRIAIGREGQAVALTIADVGPGIPPQDLPRVFEPFFTGENGRRYAGATGVGLYLVKRVVDELGHSVTVESEPGKGTTVTFRFGIVTEL